MGLQIETGIPAFTVFVQGLLSFFSPCVLPLLPLYIGYLSGGAGIRQADGSYIYPRRKVMVNTFFFAFGIGGAFFLLGLGFTVLGRFLNDYRFWIARISGVLIIIFGLYQLGIFGQSKALSKERRLPFTLDRLAMNPLTALLMGFTFSFAWTPCVGPVLSSVLLMAGSSASASSGFLLIGMYTLGFVIPFLVTGVFTGTLLNLFKKHMKVVRYTVKAGGVIMILMGVMILTGWMNGITSYLSTAGGNTRTEAAAKETAPNEKRVNPKAEEPTPSPAPAEKEIPDAPDFTLTDQYGETHTLSEYKGKVVFLNFWTTWCGFCRKEMPDIQALYEEYGENGDDLVVLGVANPKSEEYPRSSDVSEQEVIDFLSSNGYTYPVAMDESGDVFAQYGVSSFPTTVMIDKEGKYYGKVSGALTADMMESIVRQTMEGKRD